MIKLAATAGWTEEQRSTTTRDMAATSSQSSNTATLLARGARRVRTAPSAAISTTWSSCCSSTRQTHPNPTTQNSITQIITTMISVQCLPTHIRLCRTHVRLCPNPALQSKFLTAFASSPNRDEVGLYWIPQDKSVWRCKIFERTALHAT